MEGIIGIAGVMPRIGTTTMAVQLAKWLTSVGYESAYVECSGQEYIWACESVYSDVRKDRETGRTTCMGVDMYPEPALSELTRGGTKYQYLVMDLGAIGKAKPEAAGTCTARVMVCGTKPNEMFYTERALREPELRDAIAAFNFVPAEDQPEIEAMMQGRTSVFLPYLPDPFTLRMEGGVPAADACFMALMNAIVAGSRAR